MLNKNSIKNMLVVCFALGLSACANSDGLEAKVTALSNQVNSLSNDIAELKTQQQTISENTKSTKMAAEQAAKDAQKANQRIDNVVASYKK
jgi:murein lipoprotein